MCYCQGGSIDSFSIRNAKPWLSLSVIEVVGIPSFPEVPKTIEEKGSPRSVSIEPITFQVSPGIEPVIGVKH